MVHGLRRSAVYLGSGSALPRGHSPHPLGHAHAATPPPRLAAGPARAPGFGPGQHDRRPDRRDPRRLRRDPDRRQRRRRPRALGHARRRHHARRRPLRPARAARRRAVHGDGELHRLPDPGAGGAQPQPGPDRDRRLRAGGGLGADRRGGRDGRGQRRRDRRQPDGQRDQRLRGGDRVAADARPLADRPGPAQPVVGRRRLVEPGRGEQPLQQHPGGRRDAERRVRPGRQRHARRAGRHAADLDRRHRRVQRRDRALRRPRERLHRRPDQRHHEVGHQRVLGLGARAGPQLRPDRDHRQHRVHRLQPGDGRGDAGRPHHPRQGVLLPVRRARAVRVPRLVRARRLGRRQRVQRDRGRGHGRLGHRPDAVRLRGRHVRPGLGRPLQQQAPGQD